MEKDVETSVIIPNYNGSKYIINCLKSFEDQNYKNFEIIIIDDGSLDDSVKVISEYQKQSKLDIKLIKQFNQNASIARNRGIEIAKGRYLYFIDSDDEIYDCTTLEMLINEIKDCDLLIGNYIIVNEKGSKISKYKNEVDFISKNKEMFKYADISPVPSNKVYKTDIVRKNNLFFANVKIGQDINFYLKYLQFCNDIKVITKNIYKYRILPNSMTRKINLDFLDIHNSFSDVKKCYKNNQNLEKFELYITPIAIKHYHQQLTKIDKIEEKYKRSMIFSYFRFCYKEMQVKKTYRTKQNEIQTKKFWMKYILLKFKLYKIIAKIRER